MAIPQLTKFVSPDFSTNLTNFIEGYRQGTISDTLTAGITLEPDDIEYDVAIANAAAVTQYQHLINDVANNNFIQFMSGEQLDIYGASQGLPRLSSQKALTTMRFTFSEPLLNTKTIFANTAVYNSAGSATLTFYTDESEIITAGQTYYDIDCTAEASGTEYNNWNIGEIDSLATALTYVSSVHNILVTGGGGDIEDDPRYKVRLQLANSGPATASQDGIKLKALSVSTELIDVSTRDANNGASPGEIDVTILKRDISNSLLHNILDYAAVLTLVSNELNQTYNRPINTVINISPPTPYVFTLAVSLKVWKNRDLTNLVTDVQSIITEWSEELRNQLGPVFYDSVITNRIEKLSSIVQATVTVNWTFITPSLPKIDKRYIAFLTAIPTPTISEYIEE